MISFPDKNRRLHLLSFSIKSADGKKAERVLAYLAFPEIKHLNAKERETIFMEEIRIVHRFPDRDLALIKFPASNAPFFEIGEMPSPGDFVFSCGNWIGLAPSPTAGQVIRAPAGGDHFLARMPAALGDSGSGVFDREGKLVGISSTATPEGFRNFKEFFQFTSSCSEVPDKTEVERLIAEDRTKFR